MTRRFECRAGVLTPVHRSSTRTCTCGVLLLGVKSIEISHLTNMGPLQGRVALLISRKFPRVVPGRLIPYRVGTGHQMGGGAITG